jgi:hypothetical protein
MANEHSGILDGNALFADLPGFMASPPSSVPPPMLPDAYADVAFYSAPPPNLRGRYETTACSRRRPQPPVDTVRAQLIAIISCGTVALAFALGACLLYATT